MELEHKQKQQHRQRVGRRVFDLLGHQICASDSGRSSAPPTCICFVLPSRFILYSRLECSLDALSSGQQQQQQCQWEHKHKLLAPDVNSLLELDGGNVAMRMRWGACDEVDSGAGAPPKPDPEPVEMLALDANGKELAWDEEPPSSLVDVGPHASA